MQRLRVGSTLNARAKSFYSLKIISLVKSDTVSKNVQIKSAQVHNRLLKDVNQSIDKQESLQDY